MPLPTSIDDLSTTADANYPAGSDAPSVLDNTVRAHASFIATLRDTAITIDGTQTLTNKTLTAPVINAATLTGAIAGGDIDATTLKVGTVTVPTISSTSTLTNKTLTNPVIGGSVTEGVYAVTGTTPALSAANGTIQTWTLAGNSTPTESLTSGQSITLMINDGTAYTVTWPTTTWVGGAAPTLSTTGYTVVSLFKVATTLYGVIVGST
jgi:hypothetical protein